VGFTTHRLHQATDAMRSQLVQLGFDYEQRSSSERVSKKAKLTPRAATADKSVVPRVPYQVHELRDRVAGMTIWVCGHKELLRLCEQSSVALGMRMHGVDLGSDQIEFEQVMEALAVSTPSLVIGLPPAETFGGTDRGLPVRGPTGPTVYGAAVRPKLKELVRMETLGVLRCTIACSKAQVKDVPWLILASVTSQQVWYGMVPELLTLKSEAAAVQHEVAACMLGVGANRARVVSTIKELKLPEHCGHTPACTSAVGVPNTGRIEFTSAGVNSILGQAASAARGMFPLNLITQDE
jgi:hypothetical protein